MRRGFVLTPDGDAATLPRLSPFLRRKRIGAGVSHGLQIRWRYARVCRGGFDSHTLPPDDREVWRASTRGQELQAALLAALRAILRPDSARCVNSGPTGAGPEGQSPAGHSLYVSERRAARRGRPTRTGRRRAPSSTRGPSVPRRRARRSRETPTPCLRPRADDDRRRISLALRHPRRQGRRERRHVDGDLVGRHLAGGEQDEWRPRTGLRLAGAASRAAPRTRA